MNENAVDGLPVTAAAAGRKRTSVTAKGFEVVLEFSSARLVDRRLVKELHFTAGGVRRRKELLAWPRETVNPFRLLWQKSLLPPRRLRHKQVRHARESFFPSREREKEGDSVNRLCREQRVFAEKLSIRSYIVEAFADCCTCVLPFPNSTLNWNGYASIFILPDLGTPDPLSVAANCDFWNETGIPVERGNRPSK